MNQSQEEIILNQRKAGSKCVKCSYTPCEANWKGYCLRDKIEIDEFKGCSRAKKGECPVD